MARKNFLYKLAQDESGATAVEYALILGLVVIAVIASIDAVATVTVDMWNSVSDKSAAAISGT
jgi:pilus assembly protein Flp/PilA